MYVVIQLYYYWVVVGCVVWLCWIGQGCVLLVQLFQLCVVVGGGDGGDQQWVVFVVVVDFVYVDFV